MEIGLGLRAGLTIVAIAILLDRLSRGAPQGRRVSGMSYSRSTHVVEQECSLAALRELPELLSIR